MTALLRPSHTERLEEAERQEAPNGQRRLLADRALSLFKSFGAQRAAWWFRIHVAT